MKLIRWLIAAWDKRPAEFKQSSLGVVTGAAMFVYGWVRDHGFEFDGLSDPQVQAAILVLWTQVAALVTWYKAIKQRKGELRSAEDGSVVA